MSAPASGGQVGDRAPFRVATLALLASVAGLSLLGALLTGQGVGFGGGDGTVRPHVADRSALGHRALLELLRRRELPVTVARQAAEPGPQDLLLLAEPRLDRQAWAERLAALRDKARQLVVVLPKRSGKRDPRRPDWVAEVEPVPRDTIQELVELLDPGARLVRRDGPLQVQTVSSDRLPSASLPVDAQLLTGSGLTPLLAGEHGALVLEGDDGDTRLLLISDPDVLANHGLHRERNAELVLALLSERLGPGGRLLVDETLHDHAGGGSLGQALLEFPLVLLLGQMLLVGLGLVWAGLGRFGAPLPASARLRPGKDVLIGNTVDLLLSAGHHRHLLQRYLAASLERVARAVHLPPDLPRAERLQRLTDHATRRGLEPSAASPGGGVVPDPGDDQDGTLATAGEVLARARRCHAWQEEMLDGTGGHRRPR